MKLLIFIPSFLIFLYTLYKLVKDDHVFLRKNIKLEQFFDFAFIVILIGLIGSQFFPQDGISLVYLVLGGSISLYLVGKYKKFPLGRIFDYFTLSLLCSLPSIYLFQAFFTRGSEQVVNIISLFLYLILSIFFIRVMLARVLNKSIKEGTLSMVFLFLFSVISLVFRVYEFLFKKMSYLNLENITLTILLVLSIIALMIQRKGRLRR